MQSPGPTESTVAKKHREVMSRLWWVIITPLGRPVVPLV
jgi:hypothetical protein